MKNKDLQVNSRRESQVPLSAAAWRPRHIAAAPGMLAIILAVVLAAARAGVAADPLVEAPLADWSVARQAFQEIEEWVKTEKVARNPAARPILVSGVVGVRVTLRFGGLPLGQGDALSTATRPEAAVDLRDLAAKATETALARYREARERALIRPVDVNVKDGKAPAPATAPAPPPRPGQLEHIPLQVDLQVAYSLSDVVLPDAAHKKSIFFQFAAGHHGLKITNPNNGVSALQWPATAVASNLMPDSQLTQLLKEVGYSGAEMTTVLEKVARDKGPRFARFDVIHFVRPFEGQPLTQLTRGNELIPLDAIDQRTVEAMATRMAGHLSQRILAEGKLAGSLAGTYHPTSDRFEPAEATHTDSGIVAYALARRANYLASINPNGIDFHNTKEKVRAIVEYLRRELLSAKFTEGEPESRAALLITIIESPFLGNLENDRDRLGRTMQDYPVDKGVFLHPVSRKPLPAEGQALMTYALGALYEQTRDEKLATLIYQTQDAQWAATHELPELVSIMPWMAGTAGRMQRLNPATTDADKKAWAARVEAIRALMDSLREKKMIRRAPALGPADVVGGYDLLNDTGEGAPTPDWRSAYPLWLAAWAYRQPDITAGASANTMKIDATLTTRFIAQLMFDEPSCFYVRGGRREAMDGVRLALWDNRLPVKPTATALLALTQLQETLKAEK